MPGLLRKLVIVAAVDGLILHGHGVNGPRHSNGSNNEASSIRIDYKTNKITALPASTEESLEGRECLEAYGLVGKFDRALPRKSRGYSSKSYYPLVLTLI